MVDLQHGNKKKKIMIFDRLENLHFYVDIGLDFIMGDLEKAEFKSGRFEINENKEFGIDLEYHTKEESEGLWEAHRQYLDIHVILEGEEIIHINDISKMKSSRDYEPDYELFEGEKDLSIKLVKGEFLVLFPHEVHKTGVKCSESSLIKKKVYKKLL